MRVVESVEPLPWPPCTLCPARDPLLALALQVKLQLASLGEQVEAAEEQLKVALSRGGAGVGVVFTPARQ